MQKNIILYFFRFKLLKFQSLTGSRTNRHVPMNADIRANLKHDNNVINSIKQNIFGDQQAKIENRKYKN